MIQLKCKAHIWCCDMTRCLCHVFSFSFFFFVCWHLILRSGGYGLQLHNFGYSTFKSTYILSDYFCTNVDKRELSTGHFSFNNRNNHKKKREQTQSKKKLNGRVKLFIAINVHFGPWWAADSVGGKLLFMCIAIPIRLDPTRLDSVHFFNIKKFMKKNGKKKRQQNEKNLFSNS